MVGQWVAATGDGKDPNAIGVLSVGPRRIPKQSGILGVQLADAKNGVRIDRVVPKSGAAKAGILVNDVVVSVNDIPTKTRQELVRVMANYGPGDKVTIGIDRAGKKLTLKATLTSRVQSMGPNRSAMQIAWEAN